MVELALTVGTTGTALVYNKIHPPLAAAGNQGSPADGVAAVAFIVGFATVGALLVWKRTANPIGWLMSAIGLCYAAAMAEGFLAHSHRTLGLYNWLGWIWFIGLGLTVFVLLLFPTGALPSRRWRSVAWAAGIGLAGWVLGNAFAPTILSNSPSIPNPIGVGGPAGRLFGLLAAGGVGLVVASGLASLVSLVFRYRHAGMVEREQLKWLVYAGALIITALLAEIPAEKIMGPGDAINNLQNALATGSVALVPIAIGIAIFRYHLYDIEPVISKTLVYGALATFITGV